jgi:hypothetical protein
VIQVKNYEEENAEIPKRKKRRVRKLIMIIEFHQIDSQIDKEEEYHSKLVRSTT